MGGPPEIAGIIVGLKTDEIGPEYPLHQGPAPRELSHEFHRREGDVEEEADPEIGASLPQHCGNQLQLVVVDPHQGSLRSTLRRGLGKAFVGGPEILPPPPVKLGTTDHIVIEWP
jgi:hypothetical protein